MCTGATDQCNDSMDATIKNMALLKLASKGLNTDIRDKKKAAFLDSSVVRLRRRKADISSLGPASSSANGTGSN